MNVEAMLALFLLLFILGLVLRQGSDIDVTVKRCKALETRLKQELNAKGNGLGELTKSIKGKVPTPLTDNLDKIVDMRNPIVHIKNYDTLANRQEFERLCNQVEDQLNHLKAADRNLTQLLGCLVFLIMAVMAFTGLANLY